MAVHYYTASTLDGFLATPDHSLDWLFRHDFDADGPMAYPQFMTRIGAQVMGSATYEWLLRHGGNWQIDLPTWVFTTRELRAPKGADVRFVQGEVTRAHPLILRSAGPKDILVSGGGDLAGQFADAGLLEELWVQFAPVTLGEGRPLLPRPLDLELLETVRNRDFVCARYRIRRP